MATVKSFVVDETDVEPVRKDGDTASVRVTFDATTGCERLEQRVIRFAEGRSGDRALEGRQEVLYVLAGSGTLHLGGQAYPLEPNTAVFVAPGETYAVDNAGPGDLRVVSVTAPDDGVRERSRRKVTVRLEDQPELEASVERSFRYLVNEDAGCFDITQFLGTVQPSKAPFHSHPYDEVGYVVEGEGVAHLGGRSMPLRAGSCFHLPPGEVHCIENSGSGPMHILGVFHPSGSPANRTYPDDKVVEATTLAERCRHRFPIFEQRVYINSCSQGALSDAVRAAYEQYLADWDDKGAPWEYWVERQEAARADFAGLVNAGTDEVAVTTSLSAGVSALASGLRFTRRSKVVLTDWEFPTIGQIWHAQEARGARVSHVAPADDGTIPLEHFDRAIDDDTLIVAITHVCYRNGAMVDVPAVVELAHERGALVLLDAFQTIGSLPVDVAELGVDFLGAGVLKYLLGSAGLGFFYCRRDLVERVWPTQTGWFADENIFAMDHTDYSPAHTAARFQSGTPPVPSIYAGIAGIELMQEIGIAATREHVQGLNAHLLEGLDELGAQVVTPRAPERRGALVCVKSTDARELVARLEDEGIVTSDRDENLRISAHCYNTVEDVDTVLAALQKHHRLLA